MKFSLSDIFRRRASYYRDTFNSVDGAWVLRDLMVRYYAAGTTMCGSPEEMAFREGQRAVVLDIMNKLGIAKDPDRYLKELDHANRDRSESDPSRSQYASSGGNGND